MGHVNFMLDELGLDKMALNPGIVTIIESVLRSVTFEGCVTTEVCSLLV